jgi:hypothetical protein
MTKHREADGTALATTMQVFRCECCGEISIALYDENDQVFALGKLSPSQAILMALNLAEAAHTGPKQPNSPPGRA